MMAWSCVLRTRMVRLAAALGLATLVGLLVPLFSETTRAAAPRLARVSRRIFGIKLHDLRFTPMRRTRPSPTGPLSVSRDNPRYFEDPSGRVVLLAGDHTWYTIEDSGTTDPPPAFDYEKFLDFLDANGSNFFRIFVWEQAKWTVAFGGDYFYSPPLYERTGPGGALDGKPRFDLTRLNDAHFSRLRQRVMAAGARGIYVSVQLFEGFSVNKKPFMGANNPWPGHPFHAANNVNGIDGDPRGTGDGQDTETLSIPAITELQQAYVRKVIDTVNDLDNVLFEICNEGNSSSLAWQQRMIDYIHSYEAAKPKQHPVGLTVNWPGGSNAELFASSADWISPNASGGYFDDPPPADGRKVILNDTDHLCYPCGDRAWMWKSVLRGYNPAFMDPYDCTADWSPGGCDPNDRTWVSLRKNLGHAVRIAESMDLAAIVPGPELASTGYCLAGTGRRGPQYLVYFPSRGSATVNVRETRTFAVEWFDPATEVSVAGGVIHGGGVRQFASPFSEDAVLLLTSAGPLRNRGRNEPTGKRR